MKRNTARRDREHPGPEPARVRAPLDDAGCLALMDAVVLQAAKDYLRALAGLPCASVARRQRRELEAYFLSDGFARFSGLDGRLLMQRIREEVRRG